MDHAAAAEEYTLSHADVPAQMNALGEDDAITDFAIMGDVRCAHQEAIIANFGRVLPSRLTGTMNGGGFADDGAVPDFQPCLRAIGPAEKLQMLRVKANVSSRAYLAMGPDRRMPVNDAVGITTDPSPIDTPAPMTAY